MKYGVMIGIVICSALLASCAPSSAVIETAIAQTQVARPLATFTAVPSLTPTPSFTLLPSPSPTTTPTATPDLRVIDVNPKKLILTKEQMPLDGQYYHPQGWAFGPVTNSEIVAGWTVEKGQEYLAKSGRIYGYETEFRRGSPGLVAPPDVWNEVVIYSTNAGATGSVADDLDCTRLNNGYKPAKDFTIGDISAICVRKTNGQLDYWLSFAYRNQLAVIEGWGNETEIKPEFFKALAEKQLAIFKAQPLSETVTFAP